MSCHGSPRLASPPPQLDVKVKSAASVGSAVRLSKEDMAEMARRKEERM
jgi:hypothetical protein